MGKIILFLIFSLFPFSFETSELTNGKITVKFDERHRTLAMETIRILSRASDIINSKTGLSLIEEVTVILSLSDAEFRAMYKGFTDLEPAQATLAVAFPAQNTILVRTTSLPPIGAGNLPETLTHELFHIFLSQFAGRRGSYVPLWFNEGLAQWISSQNLTEEEIQMLANAARSGILLSLSQIEREFPKSQIQLAYLESYGFILFLIDNYGQRKLCELFSHIENTGEFAHSFVQVFGGMPEQLEQNWREQLARRHSFWSQFWRQITIWEILSLLSLIAFVKYIVRSRRLKKKFEEEEKIGKAPPSG